MRPRRLTAEAKTEFFRIVILGLGFFSIVILGLGFFSIVILGLGFFWKGNIGFRVWESRNSNHGTRCLEHLTFDRDFHYVYRRLLNPKP